MVCWQSMDENTKAILETVNFIKDRMLTKDDVRDITREVIREAVPSIVGDALLAVHAELLEIQRELDDLRERFENVAGFGKEIDHALERIAAIEKHLGLNNKIAA